MLRLRFFALWTSQTARVVADYCLRVFIVLLLANSSEAHRQSAWHLVSALVIAPAVFLAPLNGGLSNTLPKQFVLTMSALFCAATTIVLLLLNTGWLVGWTLVAIGAAIYSPTRYAILPAVSRDTRIPLTRVNGFIEMGSVTAVVVGMIVGARLFPWTIGPQFELAMVVVAGLHLLAVLTALPASFPSDVWRPESPTRALAGFFRDCRRVWNECDARGSLLGMAYFRGLMVVMVGGLLAVAFQGTFILDGLVELAVWIAVGIAAGSLLAGCQRHRRRVLGLVPIGATGMALGLLYAAFGAVPSSWLCLVLGLMGGLVNVPLAATYQDALPADARGNGMAVRNLADYTSMAALSVAMYSLSQTGVLSPNGQLWVIAILATIGAILSWRYLLVHVVEQVVEILLRPMYTVKGHGPGLEQIPRTGSFLIVANHAAWMDPIFLAKIIPRRLIPMMTSHFYDLPGLRWMMAHLVEAIRVQASDYRREAPELKKAIEALDRGIPVVIFPEGRMRRTEEQPLSKFGQGVWHILHERPQTPVITCWIEGNWGCFFSYYNGLPTKNKKIDFLRRIDVAVGPMEIVDPEILADQRATRRYLMEKCLETRKHLGLEPLTLPSGTLQVK